MGLQAFERRLERLVEGAFTKAFRSGLQPLEIGRRLVKELDAGRTVGVHGVVAPNHFTVVLSPTPSLAAGVVFVGRRAAQSDPQPVPNGFLHYRSTRITVPSEPTQIRRRPRTLWPGRFAFPFGKAAGREQTSNRQMPR